MKQPLQHILFAAVVLLATACGHSGNVEVKTDGALSDSTTRQIERIGETDTTRAFRMLDSLYERGEMAEHTYYYTRARVYQGNARPSVGHRQRAPRLRDTLRAAARHRAGTGAAMDDTHHAARRQP